MGGSDSVNDVGFYELVNQILSNSQRRILRERRIRPRMPFDTKQRIAPWIDREPTEEDFISVRCFDLNKNGIAFFLENPPAFKHLIVELSCPQRKLYLDSEVAHWAYVYLYPSGDIVPEEVVNELDEEDTIDLGEPQRIVLVGCRFKTRWDPCWRQ
ncbi:MAG: hypothetical protein ACUVQG_12605 [Thermogutta sp.]